MEEGSELPSCVYPYTERSTILVHSAEHTVQNIKPVNEESGLCLDLTHFWHVAGTQICVEYLWPQRRCTGSLLLHNKLPQTWQLKIIMCYVAWFLWVRNSGEALLGGSESRSPVASQMASGAGDAWELPPSRVWHMGRVQHPGLEQWGLCGPPLSLSLSLHGSLFQVSSMTP